jgi:periplasmic divalent cation tolerance protein
MTLLAVYTTVSNLEEARSMARLAIREKLAACVQIEPIESFYSWKGTVANEQEIRVLFKTRATHYDRLQQRLLQIHPYEIPAIVAIQLEHASDLYTEWVQDCLT